MMSRVFKVLSYSVGIYVSPFQTEHLPLILVLHPTRRFSSGRLICNIDAVDANVFINSCELSLCGRPLCDTDIVLPLSRDILLPEALGTEEDLRQSERQRPSAETCSAQKGTRRWEALLKSMLSLSGASLKGKPVIIINLTGYIEDLGCSATWLTKRDSPT